MVSKISNLILISALLTACSGGSLDPVKVHEGTKETRPASGATTTTLGTENPELAKIFGKMSSLSAAKDEYLKLNNWEDPKISASDEFRRFIDETHKSILQLPLKDRWSELSDFYLSFCDANLEKCKFFGTLRSSPYAANVLIDASTLQTDIHKKYRLILMAIEVNNSVFSDKNAQTFLSDIKVYRKTLIENKNQRLLSKIDGVIQILLSRVQSGKLSTANEEWITSLSLIDSIDQNFNYLGGKHLTKKDGDKIIATPDLVEEIAKTQKLDSSYSFKLNWLKTNMPKMVDQFKIKTLELDPQFFIIEQMMMDHWSVKQAVAFYKGSGLKLDPFPEIIRSYLTTQVIYLLGQSQTDLSKYVQETDRRDVLYFFDDAKAKLRKSMLFARALSQRIYKLVDFALQIDRDSAAAKEISIINDNFDKSLRVSLTVPLTFAIFDIGNRLGIGTKSIIPISKYYLSGQLPYEALVAKFFRGQLLPMLDYTLDMSESNQFETAEGIEFALRSGILELLGSTADQAMSRFVDLYQQTNAAVMLSPRAASLPSKSQLIQNEVDQLEKIKSQANFRYAMSTCESLKHPESSGRRAVQLLEMIVSPTVGRQATSLFSSGDSGGTQHASTASFDIKTLSYHPIVWSRVDAMENARLDFLPSLGIFKNLISVVEKNGIAMKVSKIKVERAFENIKKFALTFKNYYRQTIDCWELMLDYERKVAAKAVEYEYLYWKWAFERSRQGLPYQLGFDLNLPQGIEYRTKIGKNHLTGFNFDLFIRVRKYISQGIPELNLPAIDPKLDIYFNEGLETKDIYKNSPLNSVPVPQTASAQDAAEEFAKGAVKSTGFNPREKGIDWFNISFVPPDLMETNIHGLAMFYRISPFLKQTLDIDNYFSFQEVVNDHLNIIKLIDLKEHDVRALKLLGRTTIYPLQIRTSLVSVNVYPQWIIDIQDKGIPILDLFLKQLPGRWMSSYGKKEVYENPLNDHGTKRPDNLVPLIQQGVNLFYYLTDLKRGKTHLFQDSVSASKETVAYYDRLFKDDTANLMALTEKIQSVPSSRILVDLVIGDLKLPNYSPVNLEQVQANVEKFHQETGGIFKATN